MPRVSDKSKVIYLLLLLVFIIGVFVAWIDHIGLIDISRMMGSVYTQEPDSVLEARGDEPSLVAREEFEQQKIKLQERIEELDRREAKLVEGEKSFDAEREKIQEMKKGLELEKKKLAIEKDRYKGYAKNVRVLAQKIESIQPVKAVAIMVKWEDSLIIDVLRQIDSNAEEAGRSSITSYLISLMPQNKASRIMYLMTQI